MHKNVSTGYCHFSSQGSSVSSVNSFFFFSIELELASLHDWPESSF